MQNSGRAPVDDVRGLTAALKTAALGTKVSGFSCNCGAVHCPDGEVTEINLPRESGHHLPYLWTFSITPAAGHNGWWTGLTAVLNETTVETLFDTWLARSAAVRNGVGASLKNFIIGRPQELSPVVSAGEWEFRPGRATDVVWRGSNYRLPQCWEVHVTPSDTTARPWSRYFSDFATQRQFDALLTEVERRVDEGAPHSELGRREVEDTFERVNAALTAEREAIAAQLRLRYVGQDHSGYTDRSPQFAPGKITDFACTNPDFPRHPSHWSAVITPTDSSVEPWRLPAEFGPLSAAVADVVSRVTKGRGLLLFQQRSGRSGPEA